MAEHLSGVFYAYESHFLYVGALIASSRHKHHAGQIVWAPRGIVVDDDDGRRQLTVYVVPPNRPHAHGAAQPAAALWVDRDDLRWDPGAVARARQRAEGLAARLGPLSAPPTVCGARTIARELLAVIAPGEGPDASTTRHPAVVRMCSLLEETSSERDLRIGELAERSGLSMRQLRHRFAEELGLPPRAYLRWRRMRRAMAAMERGATLARAAVEAGFADAAHFSRTFRAHFGMSPKRALGVDHGGSLA